MNSLKKRLDQAVEECHNLTDERVLEISRELDMYVLQFQKNVWSKKCNREVLQ
ncbi:Spo0E family sporulation regulatory protein-aspartic acid phosphatase [Paenibacillus sp. 481]|uniref:Spo0E family sporulation regulatory protein-aspartic acid phosphatase n=1 Tax=Paenibacillus sp. 481 TaxID=2835869 RepID=UPI003FA6B1BA